MILVKLENYLLNDSLKFSRNLIDILPTNKKITCTQKDLILNFLNIKKNVKKKVDFEAIFHKKFNNKYTENFLNNLNKKYVVLFTSSLWEIESHNFGKRDAGSLSQIIEYIDETNPFPLLFVRFHPACNNLKANDMKNLIEKHSSRRIIFISPDSKLSSYLLVDKAISVISVGSQISMESYLRKKLALSFSPNRFDNFVSEHYIIRNFNIPFCEVLSTAIINYSNDKELLYDNALLFYYCLFNFGVKIKIKKFKNLLYSFFYKIQDKIWYVSNV